MSERTEAVSLSAFFFSSQDLMCVAGADGFFKKINPSFARVLGYSDDEFLRRPYLDFVHSDDRARTIEIAQAILSGKNVSGFEIQMICSDSSLKLLSWNCTVSNNSILGIARDITSSRATELLLVEAKSKMQSETARQETEQTFKHAFNQAGIGFALSDLSGRITKLNREFCRGLGVEPDQLRGQRFQDYFPSDEADEKIAALARGQIDRWVYECKLGEGDQTAIDDQIRAQEALERTVVEIKKVSEEKSELMAREQAAREASRLKSEFLANMSHEIRTPLNGIAGMTALLSATPLSELQAEYAQMIARSSEALMAIINDILDLSKIEAGKLEIVTQPFTLSRLIDDVGKILNYGAKAKNITLKCTVSRELRDRIVVGDLTRIRQILFNLVQNSVKFTHEGGVSVKAFVEAELGESRSRVRIEVVDSGIGIDPGAHGTIFQAFEQADNSTTRKFGGTGLGLSICKKLVELMGGEIGFRSAPSHGSTFWIALPLHMKSMASDAPAIKSKAEPLLSIVRGRRILVAEDHPINRKVIEQMLKNDGYEVELAVNGIEAFKKASANSFDLILMDCHMPEMDGFTAARLLRDAQWTQPIIALTADVLKGTRERCFESGMNGYLSKPIDPNELRVVLQQQFLNSPKPPAKKKKKMILDQSRLKGIDALGPDGSGSLTDELILSFISDTPKRIETIRAALLTGDAKKAQFEAHSLKSVATLLGADRFGAICSDLEAKVDVRASADLAGKMHILDSAFKEVVRPMELFVEARSLKS